MTPEDLSRYTSLVAKMQQNALNENEKKELPELAKRFAVYQAKAWEDERQAKKEAQDGELAAKREAAEKAKREEALAHQLSWLKAALNPVVDDEVLKTQWLLFRQVVEGRA